MYLIKYLVYRTAKKLAIHLTRQHIQIHLLLCMTLKIYHREIILPDHIYYEIQLLQKELSIRDGKIWSISDTLYLLIQFYLQEEIINTQKISFLKDYLHEKEPFLDELISRVTISAH